MAAEVDRGEADQGAWRLDIPCHALGITPPPCDVRLWPRGDAEADLATTPGRLPAVGRWLRQHADAELLSEGGLSEDTAHARFRRVPGPWQHILDALPVDAIALSPAGTASVFVRGSRAEVENVAASLDVTPDAMHVRPAAEGRPALSRTQRQAIQLAAALGYYDVPRRIDLRGLAARMGLTHSSVSEVLRRGEQHVMAAFCDGWMTDGQTEPAKPLMAMKTD